MPEHEARAEVERRVLVLRGEIEEERRRDVERAAAPPGGPGASPWVLIAAAGAVAVAGGVLLGVALADKASIEGLEMPTPWPEVRAQHDRVAPLSTAGIIGISVGLVGVLAGVVWVVVGGTAETEVALSPTGAVFRGRF
jgi:hypothetical protein